MRTDDCYLILGGAGLVGGQVVREIARHLDPKKIVVASLFRGEVREFLTEIRREFPDIEFVGAWGDVFVRDEFSLERRAKLLASRTNRDQLYQDLFGEMNGAYDRSGLVQLIRLHKPNVIVDSINTATAISYQDVTSLSKKTYDVLDQLRDAVEEEDLKELDGIAKKLEANVSTLLISQSLPQLIRHVQMVHRAMCDAKTRVYLKIGTTGTGGMGLNIPYTHSEDKPSAKLMSKTAVAFAHTGLMFLMARTPDGPLVKEIKPAAMIGYRQVAFKTIKRHGETQYRYQSREEELSDQLQLRQDVDSYEKIEKLHLAGVDTGENGFFARGEFETITHINQMEFVTPEEIAQKVVLELKGSNTGSDMIAGVDSTVMSPSFRAGVLRQTALDKLAYIEAETESHSVALGQLGPPELSKLLYEAYLLKLTYGTLDNVLAADAVEISDKVSDYLLANESLRSIMTSIGLPILSADGQTLIRGPWINIPESIYDVVDSNPDDVDSWARKGWVDLRSDNFVVWQQLFSEMKKTQHMLNTRGTSSVTMNTYLPETIEIGSIVAWIFSNKEGGYRIK